MNKKSNITTFTIFALKGFVQIFTLAIFIFVFSFKYLGLTFISRTLLICCGTFLLTTYLMSHIYGPLDIGLRKSKPILQSMVLNLLITNITTLVSLKIMGYHDKVSIGIDIVLLIIVVLLQITFVRIIISLGNAIYFKVTPQERVVIINNDSRHLDKILTHFGRHKKQYQIIDILTSTDISTTNFEEFDRVVLLGLNQSDFISCVERCYLLNVNIMYNAGIYDVLKKPRSAMVVDDILMYEITGNKLTFNQVVSKRLLDLVISSVAIVVLSPLMIIISIFVKANDGGKVFFSQERLTKDGKTFRVHKFRSMKENSDENPATKNDDRITKVGYYLRKFRFDELPQLFNILKGEMSLVGPRPESIFMTHKINREVPQFEFRLRVKGGLTGYAQVFGKYNTDPMDKLLLDLEYIENYSFMQDIKLLFQTLNVFIKKDSTEGFEN